MMKAGINPTIYGTGRHRRDYVYIDDAIEALIKAVDNHPPTFCGIYNIGTGINYSVKSVMKIIGEELKVDIETIYLPVKQDEPMETLAKCEKALTWLGWKSTISLREGIGKILWT